jgi:hypothetical protein
MQEHIEWEQNETCHSLLRRWRRWLIDLIGLLALDFFLQVFGSGFDLVGLREQDGGGCEHEEGGDNFGFHSDEVLTANVRKGHKEIGGR